jgi:hypothetical protein
MLTSALKEISRLAVQRLKNASQLSRVNNARRPELRICDLYEALLERQPDMHELHHWTIFLRQGHNISEAATSLLIGAEYRQKPFAHQRVLIEMPRFKLYVMEDDLDVGNNIVDLHSYEPHVTNALVEALKVGDVFLGL